MLKYHLNQRVSCSIKLFSTQGNPAVDSEKKVAREAQLVYGFIQGDVGI